MDEVTPQERMEVQRMLIQHPDLKEELNLIEQSMETFTMKLALTPRQEVKRKILLTVEKMTSHPIESKVISLNPQPLWRYAAAASIIIALGASYLAYNYRQQWQETTVTLNELTAQNQRVAQDYHVVNQKLEKIQEDFSIIESTAFHKIVMKGTASEPNALASVYWNASTEEVFLSIQNLKEISQVNQFQLWAIVDGKPVDAGVFDKGYAGLLKMKNIKGASAFAVTIEPRGGKQSPTLETMQVVGTIS